LDREPTDTFVIQAENYIEDRDEDWSELKQLNTVAQLPGRSDGDDDASSEDILDSEPEKHGEPHLAAIYEEVAELRTHVRRVPLPLITKLIDSSENQRTNYNMPRKR
jgi:hypothetical protein